MSQNSFPAHISIRYHVYWYSLKELLAFSFTHNRLPTTLRAGREVEEMVWGGGRRCRKERERNRRYVCVFLLGREGLDGWLLDVCMCVWLKGGRI